MCAVSRLHLGLCLLIVSKMERTHKLRLWCDALKASVLQEAARFEERTLLAAEAFRATEASPFRVLKTESANSYGWGGGEPFRVLRVAHANAHILRNMPIRIREGELLVGWHPNTQPDPEMGQAVQAARDYLITQNYWRNIPEGHIAPIPFKYAHIDEDVERVYLSTPQALHRGRARRRHPFHAPFLRLSDALPGVLRRGRVGHPPILPAQGEQRLRRRL